MMITGDDTMNLNFNGNLISWSEIAAWSALLISVVNLFINLIKHKSEKARFIMTSFETKPSVVIKRDKDYIDSWGRNVYQSDTKVYTTIIYLSVTNNSSLPNELKQIYVLHKKEKLTLLSDELYVPSKEIHIIENELLTTGILKPFSSVEGYILIDLPFEPSQKTELTITLVSARKTFHKKLLIHLHSDINA
ncbi:hypothetical protein ACFSTH_08360 [Paenibacillus yanchengensis]